MIKNFLMFIIIVQIVINYYIKHGETHNLKENHKIFISKNFDSSCTEHNGILLLVIVKIIIKIIVLDVIILLKIIKKLMKN